VVAHLRTQQAPVYEGSIGTTTPDDHLTPDAVDDKYEAAVALVARVGHASASLMQRHLRIGYHRAARLLEAMERDGVVGPAAGGRPRDVYSGGIPAPSARP
jgi:DNA segregation ATPase FtsK/SpoIIIE, S-DNA-T family